MALNVETAASRPSNSPVRGSERNVRRTGEQEASRILDALEPDKRQRPVTSSVDQLLTTTEVSNYDAAWQKLRWMTAVSAGNLTQKQFHSHLQTFSKSTTNNAKLG